MNIAPIMLCTLKFLKRYALDVPKLPRYSDGPQISVLSVTSNSLFSNASFTVTGSLDTTCYPHVTSAYILCYLYTASFAMIHATQQVHAYKVTISSVVLIHAFAKHWQLTHLCRPPTSSNYILPNVTLRTLASMHAAYTVIIRDRKSTQPVAHCYFSSSFLFSYGHYVNRCISLNLFIT
jgi:hypothetical protein